MSSTGATYLGENTVLLKNKFGMKMFVDSRDVGIAAHLILDGDWEHWVTAAMAPFCRNAVVVDVGANFGWYTLLAAHEGARKIHAFEANPLLVSLLKRSVAVNGIAVEVHEALVSDEDVKEELLNVDWRWSGGGTALAAQRGHESFRVWTVRLDTVLLRRLVEEAGPCVLKIDVEGFEPRVVLGATEILACKNATAFVEYHSDPKNENKLREMLDLFEASGYRMNVVKHDAKISPITREALANLGEAEMLCFRRIAR